MDYSSRVTTRLRMKYRIVNARFIQLIELTTNGVEVEEKRLDDGIMLNESKLFKRQQDKPMEDIYINGLEKKVEMFMDRISNNPKCDILRSRNQVIKYINQINHYLGLLMDLNTSNNDSLLEEFVDITKVYKEWGRSNAEFGKEHVFMGTDIDRIKDIFILTDSPEANKIQTFARFARRVLNLMERCEQSLPFTGITIDQCISMTTEELVSIKLKQDEGNEVVQKLQHTWKFLLST
jgi:hypothetical protein